MKPLSRTYTLLSTPPPPNDMHGLLFYQHSTQPQLQELNKTLQTPTPQPQTPVFLFAIAAMHCLLQANAVYPFHPPPMHCLVVAPV